MLQACINQDGDIDASLKALPIYLLASETFAVFAGHSYTLRLWVRSCLPPHATARHRAPPRATATARHRHSPPLITVRVEWHVLALALIMPW